MILGIGCSLGAGPWQCNQLLPQDGGPSSCPCAGSGSGAGAGAGSGAGSGSGSGSASLIPPPTPPPPTPGPTAKPPAAPPLATAPRREEPMRRETLGGKPPPPAGPRARLPEEVIMSAVRVLQPTFVACWKRAQRSDPSLLSARVRISLEVDVSGAVTASRTDAENEKLSRCLANVARKLSFPAPGRPAAFDVPLYF